MRKKLLAVLMTGAMVASFAGSATAVFAKSDDDNKLTVWAWDQNFNIKAMNIAGEQYAKDHEGFKVDVVETSSDDCQTKLTTAANAGDYSTLPDIVLMQDNSYQKYLKSYPDAFTDLKDININWDDFGKLKQSYSMVDDTHYGVPFDNGAVIACYRTDILDEAGYTIDDLTDITWDRFIEIGKDVLDKTGMPMLTNVQGEPDLLNMILQSAGISVFDEDGKISLVNNDGLKEAMNVYMDLINAGILQEQTDWSGYQGSINNGTVVGTINGSWICATITSTDQAEQEGNWAVTNMPKLNDYPGATNYSAQGGSTWAISSSSKNYDLAVDFFKTTWAGSTEFYDNILSQLGAIATYLPAADSDAYNQVSDYFGGEAIYSKIVSYGSNIPTINKGIYWSEEKEALGTALTNVLNGSSDLDSAIEEAQATIEFNIGQ